MGWGWGGLPAALLVTNFLVGEEEEEGGEGAVALGMYVGRGRSEELARAERVERDHDCA